MIKIFNWVTAQEIDAWTNQDPFQAQEKLSKLIIKLILSSTSYVNDFDFPYDKGIQHSGYDGFLDCGEQTNFFPKGQSVWELGTQKNIQGKFDEDLKKRSEDSLQVNRSETVFIFVTSRIWNHKKCIEEKVAMAKQTYKDWKDIRIIDACRLGLWLEQCPSVSTWLATQIGKKDGSYAEIESYWRDMTETTSPRLNEQFFLYGRPDIELEIFKWFKSENKYLLLIADTTTEALLVLSAIMFNVNSVEHEKMISRILIVRDERSWNNTSTFTNENTILIPYFSAKQDLCSLNKGRLIFLASRYSPYEAKNKNIYKIIIPRQSKKDFIEATESLGLESEKIKYFEKRTKRSFSVLYRQLTIVPFRQTPKWASSEKILDLIPALFLGSWNDSYDGDKALIEELSGNIYSEYEKKLVEWLSIEDPPIIKIGQEYMIVSVLDMWNCLWNKVTPRVYEKLLKCIIEVFQVKDPAYELVEEKWFAAKLYGKKHNYSKNLIEGIVISMIMLIEHDCVENVYDIKSVKSDVDSLVKEILDNITDWQGWYTIASSLTLLVEASPEQVLLKLEDKAKSDDIEFWKVFKQPKDFLTGRTFFTHYLWSLEKLLWFKEYVVRSITVLVLYAEKNYDYKLSNTPLNTLYHVFCPWYPQTCLSVEEKVSLLEKIIYEYPKTGWQVMEMLLKDGHQTASNISKPKWKDIEIQDNKSITNKDYLNYRKDIARICLRHISADVKEWNTLFSMLNSFLEMIDKVCVKCIDQCKRFDDIEKMEICNTIGEIICKHRQYVEADWSISEDYILKLENLYYKILPDGPIKYYNLFNISTYDLKPLPISMDKKIDFEEMEKRLFKRRREAFVDIYELYGISEIYKVIQVSKDTEDLPTILTEVILKNTLDWDIIFKIKDLNENLASATIMGFYENKGLKIFKDSLDCMNESHINFIMCSLPFEKNVWELVEKLPSAIQLYYWEHVTVFGISKMDKKEIKYIIDKLLQHNRPYTLINTIFYSKYSNSNDIIRVLGKASKLYPNAEKKGLRLEHISQSIITNLFERIYKNKTIKEKLVAKLELFYLPLLNYDQKLICLEHQLIKDPELYVEIIMLLHGKDVDDNAQSTEYEEVLEHRAFEVMERFETIPGYDSKSGNIDCKLFGTWIEKVKRISKDQGCVEAYNIYIGKLLSYSPIGEDGVWPHQCIREFIENNYTELLAENFIFGKRGQRGFHALMGGTVERNLYEKYKRYADEICISHPKVSSIIKQLSDSYLNDSRHYQSMEAKDFN